MPDTRVDLVTAACKADTLPTELPHPVTIKCVVTSLVMFVHWTGSQIHAPRSYSRQTWPDMRRRTATLSSLEDSRSHHSRCRLSLGDKTFSEIQRNSL